MAQCKICSKNIDLKNPHFVLTFSKEAVENGDKKVMQSVEAAHICEDCGEDGVSSVLLNLRLLHETDPKLKEKMDLLQKTVNMIDLMNALGLAGEKIGISNQYLAACPFHGQEASFIIDAERKEYFCICEGLKGDIFSLVMNFERDVNKKHLNLKQAVDFLLEKFPPPQD